MSSVAICEGDLLKYVSALFYR